MNNEDLITAVAKGANMTPSVIEMVFEVMANVVEEQLGQGQAVSIRGLGTLHANEGPLQKDTHHSTGELIRLLREHEVTFKPAYGLKLALAEGVHQAANGLKQSIGQ